MPLSPHDLPDLPKPSDDERAVNAKLSSLIRTEIKRDGSIPFSRFMERALYEPGLGYYAAGAQKFGPHGDFITAPESYPLFGHCLANTVADVLEQLNGGNILEVGAGSGKLAACILNALAARNALPENYYILDVSTELRDRQTTTIKQEAPAAYERVQWLTQLPFPKFRGLVLANELLDAMPVERFCVEANDITQLYVGYEEGSYSAFTWIQAPPSNIVRERVASFDLARGYVSEIGLAAEAWVRSMADVLTAGVLLLIDYGFPRAEFYHPDRFTGTLMCHYRHRAHTDPLTLVGLQDITAHVDFTAIAQAGTEAGLEVLGYTSQAAFLIGSGLEHVAGHMNPSDVRAHLALTEQIKKLTLPHEMGELYKVMALGRGITRPLPAFTLQDRRPRL